MANFTSGRKRSLQQKAAWVTRRANAAKKERAVKAAAKKAAATRAARKAEDAAQPEPEFFPGSIEETVQAERAASYDPTEAALIGEQLDEQGVI